MWWDDYVYWSIDAEIKTHDLSKFSPEEFTQYRESFYPVGGAGKASLDKAWQHHIENNPHHWENWTKQKYSNPHEWEINCVCMVVDWMAMGYKFGDTAQEYYESNKSKIKLPDYAVKYIYEIFEGIGG